MAGHSKAHGTSVGLAEALGRIGDSYDAVTAAETVPLNAALSRVLAADVVAGMNVPSADQSAVDGYAFRHADLSDGQSVALIGTAAAGRPFAGRVGRGEAVRILTGAAMPEGADTVAMQEDVARSGDRVALTLTVQSGANRRRAGEDIRAGERVLEAGRRLGPIELGLLASIGGAEISVRAPLRVALFSTGDELVDPGSVLAEGQRYDSNRPALMALLAGLGADAADLGILPDQPERIETALKDAAGRFDAILTSGGMSVGDEDHVRAAVERLGALDFWNVAIKPGRPVAAGRVGDTPFFGLPGNAAAALITFLMLVRPALLRLAGAALVEPRRFPVAAGFDLVRRAGRREYLRCVLDYDSGSPVARRQVRDGSAILTAMAACDGFLEIDETVGEVRQGAVLPFVPKSEFGL